MQEYKFQPITAKIMDFVLQLRTGKTRLKNLNIVVLFAVLYFCPPCNCWQRHSSKTRRLLWRFRNPGTSSSKYSELVANMSLSPTLDRQSLNNNSNEDPPASTSTAQLDTQQDFFSRQFHFNYLNYTSVSVLCTIARKFGVNQSHKDGSIRKNCLVALVFFEIRRRLQSQNLRSGDFGEMDAGNLTLFTKIWIKSAPENSLEIPCEEMLQLSADGNYIAPEQLVMEGITSELVDLIDTTVQYSCTCCNVYSKKRKTNPSEGTKSDCDDIYQRPKYSRNVG